MFSIFHRKSSDTSLPGASSSGTSDQGARPTSKLGATWSVFWGRKDDGKGNERPTLDQVRRWARSFDTLLGDPCGLALFQAFLQTEYSEENIQFWTACEAYRKLSGTRKLAKEAQRIYHEYLSVQAAHEVNLDSKTRLQTIAALSSPTKMTFDQAQKRIQGLMEKDSYQRFLRSEVYNNLIKELETGSGSLLNWTQAKCNGGADGGKTPP